MTFRSAIALSIVLVATPALAQDDWTEPKDGVLTEKQCEAALTYMEKFRALTLRVAEEDKKRKDAKVELTMVESLALIKKFNDELEGYRKASGLHSRELDWATARVGEIVPFLWLERVGKDEAVKRSKEQDERIAAAKKKHEEAVARRKAGRYVMTPEEKKQAEESAKSEVKEADDAVKSAELGVQEVKQMRAELEKTLKESPPEDKEAAETERKNADQAVKEAEQVLADAKARLATAKRRLEAPDAPATDEEKASLDARYAEEERAAKEEVEQLEKGRALVKDLEKTGGDAMTAELKKLPPKNVELVRARADRALKALGFVVDDAPKK